MGVEREIKTRADERGQSVVEFLLIVPMMIGLIVLLVRVNSAIQVSIVDQQYSRAQALSLAFNSNTYPHLVTRVKNLDTGGFNQLILGVSESAPPETGEFTPDASVQDIGGKKLRGSDDPGEVEPSRGRSKVRIRNTVTLCTQVNVVQDATGGFKPVIDLSDGREAAAASPSRLNEWTRFAYCRSPGGIYQ